MFPAQAGSRVTGVTLVALDPRLRGGTGAFVGNKGDALRGAVPYIARMNAPLYNTEILRLAATIPHHARLADAMGSAEKRSPICGSRVTVDVNMDADGRVAELGLLVRACALGQASSSLLGAGVLGKTPAEIAAARDQLAAWLAGAGDLPDWPGFDVFTPALPHSARHASIRLAFEAAAEAAEIAAAKRAVEERAA